MSHLRRILALLFAGLLLQAPSPAAEEPAVGFLGIGFEQLTGEPNPVRVFALYPGGPAERAGLRVGDLIVALDGGALRPLDHREALAAFRRFRPGEEVVVTVQRGDRTFEASVTATDLPPEVARHQERMLNASTESADGAMQLLRLLELASEFELRRIDANGFEIRLGPAYTTAMEVSPELLAALGTIGPIARALPGLQPGARMRFSMTHDAATGRLEVEFP